MLTKLFKYEIKSTARVFLPLYVLLIAYTLVCKAVNMISNSFRPNLLPVILTDIIYALIIFAFTVIAVVAVLSRFYKNLICDEGYLSFTLPVKPYQHIIAKAGTALMWLVASVVIGLFSLFILAYDKGLFEMLEDAIDSVKLTLTGSTDWSFAVPIAKIFLALIVQAASSILMIYASMALGQLMTGHKVLGSIVAFIALYSAIQILSLLLLAGVTAAFPTFLTSLGDILTSSFDWLLLAVSAVNIAYGALCFFITNHVFSRRLSLE